MGGPEERVHHGLLLHALYPLGGTVPGLRRAPDAANRAARRGLTAAAVKAHMDFTDLQLSAVMLGSQQSWRTRSLRAPGATAPGALCVSRTGW